MPAPPEVRDFTKRSEIDLGVDRGGGRVAVPEKVPDHLHRHALVKKMLGRRMPQRMGSPLPGDNAKSSQAVSDDFP
jgi:hypothetical protein